MSFAFQRAEDSPGFLLWQLTNQWQRQQRGALSPLSLTHGQFVVLAGVLWLSTQPDNIVTQKQVAEFTHIDKMSMSDLTTTLLKKKLLRRLHHPRDKRAYSLTLTEKGRRLVLTAIPIVEKIDANFFTAHTPQLIPLMQLLKGLVE